MTITGLGPLGETNVIASGTQIVICRPLVLGESQMSATFAFPGRKTRGRHGPLALWARRRLSPGEPSPSCSGLLLKDERLCLAEAIESASR